MSAAVGYLAPAPAETVGTKLRAYWRRRATFLVTALILFAVSLAFALLLPPTYKSTATILIEQQEIPQDLVRSAITSFADQRIQVISQRVMTTQNLMGLIDRYHLYPKTRASQPRETLMQEMRGDIGMKMISADVIDPRNGHPTQATIAFSISYQNSSPELALKVANDLTSLYLNENLTSRTQSAAQTAAFFDEQAAREQAKIVELDRSLAEFKEKHRDRLPDLQALNVQVSDRTEQALRDSQNHLAALESQRILLEAQLAQLSPNAVVYSDTGQRVLSAADRLKDLKSKLAGYRARYSPDHPDVINAEREVAGLEKSVDADDDTSDLVRQLTDAKAQLGRAMEKYTPEHPDVIRLQRQVSELEKQVAAQPAAATKAKTVEHADNPVYVQVKGQLDALNAEHDAEQNKRDELQAKLNDYERRLAGEPAVERDYRALARDLENAQLKYQQIRAKQSDVQVSQNLESERKGERFTLIEPPLPPEKPVSPNRVLILTVGSILSLVAGLGMVVIKDSMDPSVRGAADVRRLLTVPPLVAIPTIVTRRDRRIKRLRWILLLLLALATLGGAAAAIHFFVMPLDIVWLSLLRRFEM